MLGFWGRVVSASSDQDHDVLQQRIKNEPDPGSEGEPEPDGGVNNLTAQECAGDGIDAGCPKEAALGGETDQITSDRLQQQPSSTAAFAMWIVATGFFILMNT